MKPLGLALLIFCMGCGPEIIYQKQRKIKPSGWSYADTFNFPFEIKDTSQLYNLFLTLDHGTGFGSQNLYVKLYTGFPDGHEVSQQLSLDISDKIGQWLGDCDSESCILDIPIQTNAYFNQIGEHHFKLEQYMRTDSLPEINAVSFRIEVSEQER